MIFSAALGFIISKFIKELREGCEYNSLRIKKKYALGSSATIKVSKFKVIITYLLSTISILILIFFFATKSIFFQKLEIAEYLP